MGVDPKLARLLEHPAVWRGRSAAPLQVLPTGFAALDGQLPGRGWPRTGLIEILIARFGSGELDLLLPTLAALTRAAAARWCVWVAPPLMPFAPALASRGVALDRVAVVNGARPLWALEQALRSGACDAALGWARQPQGRGGLGDQARRHRRAWTAGLRPARPSGLLVTNVSPAANDPGRQFRDWLEAELSSGTTGLIRRARRAGTGQGQEFARRLGIPDRAGLT